MSSSLQSLPIDAPLKRLENVRAEMAKALLNTVESDPEASAREAFGRVIRRAVALSGMSDKEACVALGAAVDVDAEPIDKAQFSRWLSGKENPQVWRFYAVRSLRDSLRAAEALDAGLVVETVIRDDGIRRTA